MSETPTEPASTEPAVVVVELNDTNRDLKVAHDGSKSVLLRFNDPFKMSVVRIHVTEKEVKGFVIYTNRKRPIGKPGDKKPPKDVSEDKGTPFKKGDVVKVGFDTNSLDPVEILITEGTVKTIKEGNLLLDVNLPKPSGPDDKPVEDPVDQPVEGEEPVEGASLSSREFTITAMSSDASLPSVPPAEGGIQDRLRALTNQQKAMGALVVLVLAFVAYKLYKRHQAQQPLKN